MDYINNRYKMVNELGSGSYGVVWEGLDTETDESVAIKTSYGSKYGREMVRHEWDVMSHVSHPNIVRGLDFVDDSDVEESPFIVMELLDTCLARSGSAMNYEQWVELGYQLGLGVVEMWNQGWLHNDLYPRNIMIDNGNVKLLDFGMARKLDEATPLDWECETRSYRDVMEQFFPIMSNEDRNGELGREYRHITEIAWYEPIELLDLFASRRQGLDTNGRSLVGFDKF